MKHQYVDQRTELLLCIGKNTGAMFDEAGEIIGGNATDKALLSFLTKENYEAVQGIKVFKSQQFNSANKYSAAGARWNNLLQRSP